MSPSLTSSHSVFPPSPVVLRTPIANLYRIMSKNRKRDFPSRILSIRKESLSPRPRHLRDECRRAESCKSKCVLRGFEQRSEPWSLGSSKLNYLRRCIGWLVFLISTLGKGCSLAVLLWNLRESSTAHLIALVTGSNARHWELVLSLDEKPGLRHLSHSTRPEAFPLPLEGFPFPRRSRETSMRWCE